MSDLSKKRVITAALCGSWPTKDMNPAVPYTPEEIARDAYECWALPLSTSMSAIRTAVLPPILTCIRRRWSASGPTKTAIVHQHHFLWFGGFRRRGAYLSPAAAAA